MDFSRRRNRIREPRDPRRDTLRSVGLYSCACSYKGGLDSLGRSRRAQYCQEKPPLPVLPWGEAERRGRILAALRLTITCGAQSQPGNHVQWCLGASCAVKRRNFALAP